jgi:DNA-damage-inducible protein J
MRASKKKTSPLQPLIPNAESIEAMKAARGGELVKVGSPEKLLESLNEGD